MREFLIYGCDIPESLKSVTIQKNRMLLLLRIVTRRVNSLQKIGPRKPFGS